MTDKSSNVTELYAGIQKQCAHAGISVRAACMRAGVDYSTISKWRTKTPKSIDMLNKLRTTIESIVETK